MDLHLGQLSPVSTRLHSGQLLSEKGQVRGGHWDCDWPGGRWGPSSGPKVPSGSPGSLYNSPHAMHIPGIKSSSLAMVTRQTLVRPCPLEASVFTW